MSGETELQLVADTDVGARQRLHVDGSCFRCGVALASLPLAALSIVSDAIACQRLPVVMRRLPVTNIRTDGRAICECRELRNINICY